MAEKSQQDQNSFGILVMAIMVIGTLTLGAGVFGFLVGAGVSLFLWWGMTNPRFQKPNDYSGYNGQD